MGKDIQFREAQPQDVQAITELVLGVFDKYVGYGYSLDGQSVFRMYCLPNAMSTRLTEGTSFCLVAILVQKIIGMIEVRNGNHIALLFVDDRYHKNGIAKNLVTLAIEKVKVTDIYVNSSPYAIDIYKRMGFEQLEEEQERDGIRFIPMKKSITHRNNC
ncbi:MAG: GNAT family N-acetyltransferase [Desulfitobacteriaceae bacterium]